MAKKSTKRALLLSTLSLLMCVSMLIGSTYAWFTDSVTSAGNIIKSGTLEVTMEWKDASTSGAQQAWKDASEGAIFNYDRWEPGYVEAKNIKIGNAGTLALKYQLHILATGMVSELADVIDVYYAEGEYILDREMSELTYIGTLSAVLDRLSDTASGDLIAGESDVVTLALKMQETAGNQYQGLSIGSAFAIQLVATQLASEFDSFDNQYDAGLDAMENGVSRDLPDGSTAFYYGEDSGYYGRVRLTALPENVGSEYVVPAEINDLGDALVGADLDKLTLPADLQYGYKSIEGAHIDEVVIADGMTNIPNRLFYKAYVGNVVIPDSVTAIDESAFQQAYIDELVVPANVENFGVHAFAGSSLQKITFEGSNLVFDNRPMRECANLRTVVFNCEDITFMNTTTNGDCWISNKGANGNNYSNITFYVKNATVAAKVRAAIIHENPATTPIYVDEATFVTAKNITELNNALSSSYTNTIVSLTADITGDLNFAQNPDGYLVINGNGHKFDGSINIDAQSNTTSSGSITIKNVNFKTDANELTFIQSIKTNHYPLNVTVSGCTFEGTGAGSNVVAISIKSAKNFVLEDCTANNVHSILQNNSGWNLTIRNVTVTNSGRGMALGTVQGVTVDNVTIDAAKYGIRLDAGYNNNAVINDCNVKAFIPVVVRKISVNSSMSFNGTNTMTQTNTDGIWCAIGNSEYEENGVMPTAAANTVVVTVNDAGLDTNGIFNNSNI